MKVNILGNFDINAGTILPGFAQTGKWYEYFTDDSITVSSVNAPINLFPGEYRLYSTVRMKSPRFLLGIKDELITDPKHFLNVYPNPSAEEFTIETKGLQPAPVTISISDNSGRIIRQIKSEVITDGPQLFKWDGKTNNGSKARQGIYFIQVQIQGRTETVKIIKE